jgi:hypothetical protein
MHKLPRALALALALAIVPAFRCATCVRARAWDGGWWLATRPRMPSAARSLAAAAAAAFSLSTCPGPGPERVYCVQ